VVEQFYHSSNKCPSRRKCLSCGKMAKRVVANVVTPKVWDQNLEFQHLGPKPLKFKSEADLRRHCKENHLWSNALL
jgi:hypothetical protein